MDFDQLAPALPDDELERVVVRGTSEQSAFLAWWLSALAELDRRELWQAAGFPTCTAWLMARCGSSHRTAREHVWLANRLEEAPLTRAAFAEGRLSYSKVRALCRVAKPDNEAFLLGLAEDMTASQLERHVRRYEATHRAPQTWEELERLEAMCGVTTWTDALGLVHHEVVTPPEEGVVIDLAIRYGAEQVYKQRRKEAKAAGVPVERVSAARRRFDGLVWAVRRGLANAELDPTPVEDPFLFVFHVRQGEAFYNEAGDLDLGRGRTVPRHVADRLQCSSMVQAMLVDPDERPLDLGRRARVASKKQKLALSALYEGCAFPGCTVPLAYCQFHHVDWWGRDDGRTDLANLRPQCRFHHRLLHEGGWQLLLDDAVAGGVVAISPTGRRFSGTVPPLTDEAVSHEALVARLDSLGLGHRDGDVDSSRYASLGGRWGGERLNAWATAEVGSAIADACDGTGAWAGRGDDAARVEPPTAA